MRFLDGDAVRALGPEAAVRAVTEALGGGLDPAADPPRVPVRLSHGEFLLMPAEAASAAGVKVVTVAPDNPSRGLAPHPGGLPAVRQRDARAARGARRNRAHHAPDPGCLDRGRAAATA